MIIRRVSFNQQMLHNDSGHFENRAKIIPLTSLMSEWVQWSEQTIERRKKKKRERVAQYSCPNFKRFWITVRWWETAHLLDENGHKRWCLPEGGWRRRWPRKRGYCRWYRCASDNEVSAICCTFARQQESRLTPGNAIGKFRGVKKWLVPTTSTTTHWFKPLSITNEREAHSSTLLSFFPRWA